MLQRFSCKADRATRQAATARCRCPCRKLKSGDIGDVIRRPVPNAPGTNAPDEVAAVGTVAIPHHIARCLASPERLGESPRNPLGGRMGGYRQPKQLAVPTGNLIR